MKKINSLTPRKIKALETKKTIYESAVSLFGEKGYNTVSVDDITAKAGTSKGTFYLYFKNKEDVILEKFKAIDSHYLNAYNSLDKNQTVSDKILNFVREQHTYALEEFGLELLKVVYYSQLVQNQENIFLADEKRVLYRIVENLILEGQQKKEFRTDVLAKDLTKMITRWMRGLLYDWCIHDGKYDLVEEGQKSFLMITEGILKAR